jgi:hypothetical protein
MLLLILKLLSKNILVDPIIHEIADGLDAVKQFESITKYYFYGYTNAGHEWI